MPCSETDDVEICYHCNLAFILMSDVFFLLRCFNVVFRRVATVRENIWKMEFFPGQGKSGNLVDGLGNLERTWKVREKSGNLKINGYGRQSSENSFILYKRGKDVHYREIV